MEGGRLVTTDAHGGSAQEIIKQQLVEGLSCDFWLVIDSPHSVRRGPPTPPSFHWQPAE